MERAIVLVNLSPGAEADVVSALKGMRGVEAFYQLYGLYDLLVIVHGQDDQEVKATIGEGLRANKGVVSTITMKILE